jgi:hypothetical protein
MWFSRQLTNEMALYEDIFGKQVTKETKLRIHNITDKAAFKFDSEAWVLRKETNKD